MTHREFHANNESVSMIIDGEVRNLQSYWSVSRQRYPAETKSKKKKRDRDGHIHKAITSDDYIEPGESLILILREVPTEGWDSSEAFSSGNFESTLSSPLTFHLPNFSSTNRATMRFAKMPNSTMWQLVPAVNNIQEKECWERLGFWHIGVCRDGAGVYDPGNDREGLSRSGCESWQASKLLHVSFAPVWTDGHGHNHDVKYSGGGSGNQDEFENVLNECLEFIGSRNFDIDKIEEFIVRSDDEWNKFFEGATAGALRAGMQALKENLTFVTDLKLKLLGITLSTSQKAATEPTIKIFDTLEKAFNFVIEKITDYCDIHYPLVLEDTTTSAPSEQSTTSRFLLKLQTIEVEIDATNWNRPLVTMDCDFKTPCVKRVETEFDYIIQVFDDAGGEDAVDREEIVSECRRIFSKLADLCTGAIERYVKDTLPLLDGHISGEMIRLHFGPITSLISLLENRLLKNGGLYIGNGGVAAVMNTIREAPKAIEEKTKVLSGLYGGGEEELAFRKFKRLEMLKAFDEFPPGGNAMWKRNCIEKVIPEIVNNAEWCETSNAQKCSELPGGKDFLLDMESSVYECTFAYMGRVEEDFRELTSQYEARGGNAYSIEEWIAWADDIVHIQSLLSKCITVMEILAKSGILYNFPMKKWKELKDSAEKFRLNMRDFSIINKAEDFLREQKDEIDQVVKIQEWLERPDASDDGQNDARIASIHFLFYKTFKIRDDLVKWAENTERMNDAATTLGKFEKALKVMEQVLKLLKERTPLSLSTNLNAFFKSTIFQGTFIEKLLFGK